MFEKLNYLSMWNIISVEEANTIFNSFFLERKKWLLSHTPIFIHPIISSWGGGVLMLLFTNLSDKSNMNYRDEEGNPQIKTVHPAAHAVLGPSFSLPVSYLTYF